MQTYKEEERDSYIEREREIQNRDTRQTGTRKKLDRETTREQKESSEKRKRDS